MPWGVGLLMIECRFAYISTGSLEPDEEKILGQSSLRTLEAKPLQYAGLWETITRWVAVTDYFGLGQMLRRQEANIWSSLGTLSNAEVSALGRPRVNSGPTMITSLMGVEIYCVRSPAWVPGTKFEGCLGAVYLDQNILGAMKFLVMIFASQRMDSMCSKDEFREVHISMQMMHISILIQAALDNWAWG